MQKITVLLADDHTVVRQGLRALLAAEEDIEVVGEADTGRQAVQIAKRLLPDVVTMNIAMPLLNGLEATRQITKELPSTKVLILSSYSDDEYVQQLTEAGAIGYLVKQTAANDLFKAIRDASKGNAFFCPIISKRLMDYYRDVFTGRRTGKKKTETLTSREREVLQLIAEGKANKQIAAELCISIKTVEGHRQQVMNKLNIHDIAGLTRYAISKGILEISTVAAFADVPPTAKPEPQSVNHKLKALRLIVKGKSNGEIAAELQMEVSEVEAHRQHLLKTVRLL